MDFGKAFTFIFDDPEWIRKVGISALIGLIPIVGQLYLLGWGLEVTRRMAAGVAELLPDIDFGTYLGHGFKAFVVALVWTAPIWVLAIVVAIVSSLTYNSSAAYNTAPRVANAAATIVSICFGLFAFVYGIFAGIALPAAFSRTVIFGSIGDGLAFGKVWKLVSAAIGPWVLALIGNIVAGILASIIGSIACGIGVFITTAMYQVIMGHFYGQAYLAAKANA
jgi:hypothetical protein